MLMRCLLASVMIASLSMNAMEEYSSSSSDEESEQSYRTPEVPSGVIDARVQFANAYSRKNLPLMRQILESGHLIDKERALFHTISENDRLGTALLLYEPINMQWSDNLGGFLHAISIDQFDGERTRNPQKALAIAEELILLGVNPHIKMPEPFCQGEASAFAKINKFAKAEEIRWERYKKKFSACKETHAQKRTSESAQQLRQYAKELTQSHNKLTHYFKAMQLFCRPALYFTTEHFTPERLPGKRKPNVVSILRAREMGIVRKKARGLVALARPETLQETIQSGDMQALKEFVAANPESTRKAYNLNNDPLLQTVSSDNKEARRFLIQRGMDPKIIFSSVINSFNIPVLRELLEEYQVNPTKVQLPTYNNPQNWMDVANAHWAGNEPKELHDEKKRQAVALLQAAQERHRIS